MKKYSCLLLLLMAHAWVSGQVGINTDTPDSTAALDIQSPGGSDNRGVLLPRMTSTQRLGIVNPATSLMVFDTDKKLLFYYDGYFWIPLIPAERPTGSYPPGASPQISGHIVIDTGSVTAPQMNAEQLTSDQITVTTTLNVDGFAPNALVPTGSILMWSGPLGSIPAGWALCDGTAGRPDLRGRFIVGQGQNGSPAPGDYNPTYTINQAGGENMHRLTAAESGVPLHTHSTDPHSHSQSLVRSDAVGPQIEGNSMKSDNERGLYRWDGSYTTGTTTVSVNYNTEQDAATQHENRPAYYALAYIIKL